MQKEWLVNYNDEASLDYEADWILESIDSEVKWSTEVGHVVTNWFHYTLSHQWFYSDEDSYVMTIDCMMVSGWALIIWKLNE